MKSRGRGRWEGMRRWVSSAQQAARCHRATFPCPTEEGRHVTKTWRSTHTSTKNKTFLEMKQPLPSRRSQRRARRLRRHRWGVKWWVTEGEDTIKGVSGSRGSAQQRLAGRPVPRRHVFVVGGNWRAQGIEREPHHWGRNKRNCGADTPGTGRSTYTKKIHIMYLHVLEG